MTITAFTSQEFVEDNGRARMAAHDGPVVSIESKGPAYVLLTIEEYYRLGGARPTMVDLLASPRTADIEFEPPRMEFLSKPVDWS